MKNLTLKQLRKAIEIITTSEEFEKFAGHVELLRQAKAYMEGNSKMLCIDPRPVLKELNYKW